MHRQDYTRIFTVAEFEISKKGGVCEIQLLVGNGQIIDNLYNDRLHGSYNERIESAM